MMRAWTEKDTFAFNGRFNQQRYVNIWPRPVQQPHPPVWIPGGGSVETWQWCAEMDYVYCVSVVFRLQGRQGNDGWFLARNGPARQGPQPQSRRVPAVRRRRRDAGKGDGTVSRAGGIFLWPLPVHRSDVGLAARLHHRGDDARRSDQPGRPRRDAKRAHPGARHRNGRHRRQGLCHFRLARRRGGTTDRGRGVAERRAI